MIVLNEKMSEALNKGSEDGSQWLYSMYRDKDFVNEKYLSEKVKRIAIESIQKEEVRKIHRHLIEDKCWIEFPEFLSHKSTIEKHNKDYEIANSAGNKALDKFLKKNKLSNEVKEISDFMLSFRTLVQKVIRQTVEAGCINGSLPAECITPNIIP